LKDQVKFDQVAEEVIRRGKCVNDTIIETKEKEVVVYKDSIVKQIDSIPCNDFDTTIGNARIRVSSGVLTYSAKDSIVYKTKTIKQTVRDRSLEAILEADIAKANKVIDSLNNSLKSAKIDNKDLRNQLGWMKVKFIGLVVVAVGIIFRKQLFKLVGGFI
jgi:hypothetical protein